MSSVTRRTALRMLAAGTPALAATAATPALASGPPTPRPDAAGMLYDATRCVGCQACVAACAEANDLPPDPGASGGLWQMPLDLNSKTRNIIKLHDEPGSPQSFVKRQCMHCLDPACVAGCPFSALTKGDRGVVTWNANACIGCRYCEISCPFDVPKFEWDRFSPKIVKCELCKGRLDAGKQPACTEVCPTHAVIYGKRADLLDEAHRRLARTPDAYAEKRVYGETEGGGTQVLYLSGVPFEKLGLPKLAPTAHPAHELRAQELLYKGLAIPALLYGLVAMRVRKQWKEHEGQHAQTDHGLKEQL